MKGRALVLPPVNRNDAKVAVHLSDLADSRSSTHCAMQYSKGRAIPITVHQGPKRLVRQITRLPSKRAALVLFALPVLILAGCSDSLTSAGPSPSSFDVSNKQLGKTLSQAERKAAIADLQNEQAKRQGSADETTASVKPAEAGN